MSSTWLKAISQAYKAGQSAVHIIITSDAQRRIELIKFLPSLTLAGQKEPIILEVDMGLNICYEIKINDGLSYSDPQPFDPVELWRKLTSSRIFVIIKTVFSPEQGNSLAALLYSVALDDRVFYNDSAVFVFATSSELFPEPLLKISHVVDVPTSTDEERLEKMKELARQIKEHKGIEITLDPALIPASAGLNLKEVETVVLKAFTDKKAITIEDFTAYKKDLLRAAGLEFIPPEFGFEHIGGYDQIKAYIKNRFVRLLRDPNIAQYYGLPLPKGFVLYGLPGTGKTMFSMALAKEVGLPMVKLTPDKLFHWLVGKSEQETRRIAKVLESLAPVIVFVDEADQLFINRAQLNAATDSGVTSRIIGGLLEWLGDPHRKSFVVLATNYVDRIDPALMRPGRIDEVVPIPLPDLKAREEILKVHTSVLRKMPIKGDITTLAPQLELWTGAEIEKLCLEAATLAMMNGAEYITSQHFEELIPHLSPDKNLREQAVKSMMETLKKIENVDRRLIWSIMTTESISRADKVLERL